MAATASASASARAVILSILSLTSPLLSSPLHLSEPEMYKYLTFLSPLRSAPSSPSLDLFCFIWSFSVVPVSTFTALSSIHLCTGKVSLSQSTLPPAVPPTPHHTIHRKHKLKLPRREFFSSLGFFVLIPPRVRVLLILSIIDSDIHIHIYIDIHIYSASNHPYISPASYFYKNPGFWQTIQRVELSW